MLEKCLATSNPRIITNTVRRLIPSDAAVFLRATVDRVLSKPARAVQLAPWIKAVMHYHTGYMMQAPGVQGALAALYQVKIILIPRVFSLLNNHHIQSVGVSQQAIDSRVGLYQQLLKVYGRLSLITAHTNAAAQQSAAAEDGDVGETDDGVPAPEVMFEDGVDDDEPEAEDPFAADDNDDDDDDSDGGIDDDGGFDDAGDDDSMGGDDDDDDDE